MSATPGWAATAAARITGDVIVQALDLTSLDSAGALSSYVPPPPSLLAAYADEPALGVFHLELRDALRVAVTSALVGGLPRV